MGSLSPDRPFFISPPFGSYFHNEKAYSVRGSYTRFARPNRFKQILRTVRPVPGGWINKIGLRNPGMLTVREWPDNEVMSLALIDGDKTEWDHVVDYALARTGVMRSTMPNPVFEFNISCPNTNHPVPAMPDKVQVRSLVCHDRPTVVFKLQPLESSISAAVQLADWGVTYLHFSNTLPSPIGGISGAPLREVNLPLIEKVRNALVSYPVEIIGGGGIYSVDHLRQYRDAGAVRFSLSTAWVWPPRALRIINALRRPIPSGTRIVASSHPSSIPIGAEVTSGWQIQDRK